jgi:FixJ family two-component response regulator
VNQSNAPRVLVVDDDAVLCRVLCRFLNQFACYEVLPAANGQEALQVFERYVGRIEVLVTDMRMPGMSGLDLIDALRRIVKQPIAVIAITGHGTVPMAVRFMRGSDDLVLAINFLQKPFEDTEIADAVVEGLRRIHAMRAIPCSSERGEPR